MILFKDINKGDMLFEVGYGMKIVFEVKTQPEKNDAMDFCRRGEPQGS